MTFSENWEENYASGKGLSVWPWTTLVSLVHRYVPPEWKNARVLELGCGIGANYPLFQKLSHEYFATEGSATAVKSIIKRFPELSERVWNGDFSKEIPGKNYDLIVDRASLTHNDWRSIQRTVDLIYQALKPGGIFMGVHWFSCNNDFASKGIPLENDPSTRTGFETGPYQGLGPVRFFTQEELVSLFSSFKILEITEEVTLRNIPRPNECLAAWYIVAQKPKKNE